MLPISWIDALFSRFEGMYGAQFHAKWAGVDILNAKQVWAETLDGMSGETIKAALIECAKVCEYPPGTPEFYRLCKAQKVLPSHQQFIPKLHDKDLSAGTRRIAEMRDILAGKMIGGK